MGEREWFSEMVMSMGRDVPPRVCTVCRLMGRRTPATVVAAAADGLEWFECDGHGVDAHPYGPRVATVAVAEWFKRGFGA